MRPGAPVTLSTMGLNLERKPGSSEPLGEAVCEGAMVAEAVEEGVTSGRALLVMLALGEREGVDAAVVLAEGVKEAESDLLGDMLGEGSGL